MNADVGNANGGVPTVPESAVENNPVVSPLDNLKDAVNAVQQQEQVQGVQAPTEKTPEQQFTTQFGQTPQKPLVAETPLNQNTELNPAGMGVADASSQPSTENLIVQQDQQVEAAPKAEEASLDPKQKFINSVEAALEEFKASKENQTASS